jgi:very-short-patch-repair endonuclease
MFGLKFKRQVPMGKYVVDFCCQEYKLVVELDGGHHARDQEKKTDTEKETYLNNKGYRVLRFWNNDVESNLEGVLEVIRQAAA